MTRLVDESHYQLRRSKSYTLRYWPLRRFFCDIGSAIISRPQAHSGETDTCKWLFVGGRARRRRHELRQTELLVRELGGAVGVLPINYDRDFDLGG